MKESVHRCHESHHPYEYSRASTVAQVCKIWTVPRTSSAFQDSRMCSSYQRSCVVTPLGAASGPGVSRATRAHASALICSTASVAKGESSQVPQESGSRNLIKQIRGLDAQQQPIDTRSSSACTSAVIKISTTSTSTLCWNHSISPLMPG